MITIRIRFSEPSFQSMSTATLAAVVTRVFVCGLLAERPPTTVDGSLLCAWCDRVLLAGDTAKPVSPGICADCQGASGTGNGMMVAIAMLVALLSVVMVSCESRRRRNERRDKS